MENLKVWMFEKLSWTLYIHTLSPPVEMVLLLGLSPKPLFPEDSLDPCWVGFTTHKLHCFYYFLSSTLMWFALLFFLTSWVKSLVNSFIFFFLFSREVFQILICTWCQQVLKQEIIFSENFWFVRSAIQICRNEKHTTDLFLRGLQAGRTRK